MVLIFIGCIATAGAIGFVTATLFKAGADHREEPPHREPTKLLTVGCSVKYHGRIWEILWLIRRIRPLLRSRAATTASTSSAGQWCLWRSWRRWRNELDHQGHAVAEKIRA